MSTNKKVIDAYAKVLEAHQELTSALMEMCSPTKVYTVREYAQLTKLHPSTITRQLASGILKGRKVSPQKWIVEVSECH